MAELGGSEDGDDRLGIEHGYQGIIKNVVEFDPNKGDTLLPPEPRDYIKELFDAIRNLEGIVDKTMQNGKPCQAATRIATGYYPPIEIERACWDVLITIIEGTGPGKKLVPEHHGFTRDDSLETFKERFDGVVHNLKVSKAMCKQLLDPRFLDRLVDDPKRELKSKENNKQINSQRDIQNSIGRQAIACGVNDREAIKSKLGPEIIKPKPAKVVKPPKTPRKQGNSSARRLSSEQKKSPVRSKRTREDTFSEDENEDYLHFKPRPPKTPRKTPTQRSKQTPKKLKPAVFGGQAGSSPGLHSPAEEMGLPHSSRNPWPTSYDSNEGGGHQEHWSSPSAEVQTSLPNNFGYEDHTQLSYTDGLYHGQESYSAATQGHRHYGVQQPDATAMSGGVSAAAQGHRYYGVQQSGAAAMSGGVSAYGSMYRGNEESDRTLSFANEFPATLYQDQLREHYERGAYNFQSRRNQAYSVEDHADVGRQGTDYGYTGDGFVAGQLNQDENQAAIATGQTAFAEPPAPLQDTIDPILTAEASSSRQLPVPNYSAENTTVLIRYLERKHDGVSDTDGDRLSCSTEDLADSYAGEMCKLLGISGYPAVASLKDLRTYCHAYNLQFQEFIYHLPHFDDDEYGKGPWVYNRRTGGIKHFSRGNPILEQLAIYRNEVTVCENTSPNYNEKYFRLSYRDGNEEDIFCQKALGIIGNRFGLHLAVEALAHYNTETVNF